MTSLSLDDSPAVPQMPRRVDWGRQFDRFFPLFVAAAVSVGGIYYRFQSMEAKLAEVDTLHAELKATREEMTQLKLSIMQLQTRLQYLDPFEEPDSPRRPHRVR